MQTLSRNTKCFASRRQQEHAPTDQGCLTGLKGGSANMNSIEHAVGQGIFAVVCSRSLSDTKTPCLAQAESATVHSMICARSWCRRWLHQISGSVCRSDVFFLAIGCLRDVSGLTRCTASN